MDNNIRINKITTGDIFLCKSNSILSIGIQQSMQLYAQENGIQYNWIGSHAGSLYWEALSLPNGFHLYIEEAVMGGAKENLLIDAYNLGEIDLSVFDYKVLTPIIPLTPQEKYKFVEICHKYHRCVKDYQYAMIPQWLLYIFSDKLIDIFGTGGAEHTYCYELTARIWNDLRPGTFKNPLEITSFFDIYNNINFKLKDL